MSQEEPTQRADDKTLAVFVQKFTDFMVTSIDNQRQVIAELKELREKTFNLPCKVHEQRVNDIGTGIIALWVIVGTIGTAVLAEVIKFWNK